MGLSPDQTSLLTQGLTALISRAFAGQGEVSAKSEAKPTAEKTPEKNKDTAPAKEKTDSDMGRLKRILSETDGYVSILDLEREDPKLAKLAVELAEKGHLSAERSLGQGVTRVMMNWTEKETRTTTYTDQDGRTVQGGTARYEVAMKIDPETGKRTEHKTLVS